jgi:hypothetical protein
VYSYPAQAYATLRLAQAAVAPAPLFIGEAGFATGTQSDGVSGMTATQPAMEAYQDLFYRSVDLATRSLGQPDAAPWIYSDFAPGSLTWLAPTSIEYSYGLLRVDGSSKPAATTESNFFTSGAVDSSFNNSFEQGDGIQPLLWRTFYTGQAQFTWDTSMAHTGAASVRISRSAGDSNGVPSFFITPPSAQIAPGQTHTASVWARGSAATGQNRIALAWFDASGNYLGQVESPLVPPGTSSWLQLTVSGSAPPSAASVAIYLKSSNNSGSLWFDDVSFT